MDRVIYHFIVDTEYTRDVICAADVVVRPTEVQQSGVTRSRIHQTPLLVSNLPGLKVPIEKDQYGYCHRKI